MCRVNYSSSRGRFYGALHAFRDQRCIHRRIRLRLLRTTDLDCFCTREMNYVSKTRSDAKYRLCHHVIGERVFIEMNNTCVMWYEYQTTIVVRKSACTIHRCRYACVLTNQFKTKQFNCYYSSGDETTFLKFLFKNEDRMKSEVDLL